MIYIFEIYLELRDSWWWYWWWVWRCFCYSLFLNISDNQLILFFQRALEFKVEPRFLLFWGNRLTVNVLKVNVYKYLCHHSVISVTCLDFPLCMSDYAPITGNIKEAPPDKVPLSLNYANSWIDSTWTL